MQYAHIIYRALHDQKAINTDGTKAAQISKNSWRLLMLASNCTGFAAIGDKQQWRTGCAVCILVLATSRGSTHDHMNMPASPPHVTAEAESLSVSSIPGSGLLDGALPGKLLLSACRIHTVAAHSCSHASLVLGRIIMFACFAGLKAPQQSFDRQSRTRAYM